MPGAVGAVLRGPDGVEEERGATEEWPAAELVRLRSVRAITAEQSLRPRSTLEIWKP